MVDLYRERERVVVVYIYICINSKIPRFHNFLHFQRGREDDWEYGVGICINHSLPKSYYEKRSVGSYSILILEFWNIHRLYMEKAFRIKHLQSSTQLQKV